MNLYICMYIYICLFIYTHIYICRYRYVCIYIHTMYTYIHAYVIFIFVSVRPQEPEGLPPRGGGPAGAVART